jgi:hypothetical protein
MAKIAPWRKQTKPYVVTFFLCYITTCVSFIAFGLSARRYKASLSSLVQIRNCVILELYLAFVSSLDHLMLFYDALSRVGLWCASAECPRCR